MSKVTIKDIAKAAGVSVGTVSKVLNGDQTVKEVNRRAVETAVALTGYNVNQLARSLAHKPIRLGIILPSMLDEYFLPMVRGIEQEVASLVDHKVEVLYKSYSPEDDDETITAGLEELAAQQVNGILLGPLHHLHRCNRIFEALHRHRLPYVLVVSDLIRSRRLASISIDAELSGRMAAELAHLAMPEQAQAAIFVGDRLFEEHRRKAESFRTRLQQLRGKEPALIETQDDPQAAFGITCQLLQQPQLQLIYVATGNYLAVCRAVCHCGRQQQVQVIATDVRPGLEKYIFQGPVIGVLDQHLADQGAMAVRTLHRYLAEGVLHTEKIKLAPELLLPSAVGDRLRNSI